MDFQSKIRLLYSLLFPTGRAWQYNRGSENREGIQDNFTDGVSGVFVDGVSDPFFSLVPQFIATIGKRIGDAKLKLHDQLYSDMVGILNTIIPDNEEFDSTDADRWESTFEIVSNLTDIEERKTRILRRLFYPNGVVERSNVEFIQDQLRASGFDVYVVENRFWNGSEYEVQDPDALTDKDVQLGLGNLGVIELGGIIPGTNYTGIIANYVNEDLDNQFFSSTVVTPPELGENQLGAFELGGQTSVRLPRDIQLQGSFFIGGQSFPSFASVPLSRKDEFRALLLKLKPVHTLGYLYINFI